MPAEGSRTAIKARDRRDQVLGALIMQSSKPPLSGEDLTELVHHLPEWALEDGKLVRFFTFPDFVQAIAFVNRVAQLAEQAGHHPDIEEGQDLPDLHRRPLHGPERGDDLFGSLDVPPLECRVATLRRAGHVGCPRPGLADGLARRQAPDSRCSPHTRGGDLVLRHAGLALLNLRAGHDVVRPVGPADPGLVAAVVVVTQQDQRRLLVQRPAGLVALRVQAAPDPDERWQALQDYLTAQMAECERHAGNASQSMQESEGSVAENWLVAYTASASAAAAHHSALAKMTELEGQQ